MFTPTELETIPFQVEKLYKDLEYRIMSDIVRRIKINSEITRSADWQIYRLIELGKSKREIKKFIKDTLNLSTKEINHLYKDIIHQGYARDEQVYKTKGTPIISFTDNEPLKQLITAMSLQTANELQNITQSLGFAVKKGNVIEFLPIAKYYQRVLDGAMLDIASGAFDYSTVLKRTVSELTNSGLRTVDYVTGWNNRTEVATRRAIMTGITQLTSHIDNTNAEALDTNLFEVSYHTGARPTHQTWQGKVYTKEHLSSVCGLGTGAGLCGWNCYHSYYPFIEGLSERLYTDEQLDEMNEQENTPTPYKGKEYTAYKATQEQRKLETKLRVERQSIKLLQDGGADESDLINARAKYRITSSEYVSFSKAMGLPQQRERVTIDGLGGIGKGRYTNDRIVIGKSVGAKAKDQFVLLPDGTKGKLKEGSSITKIVTFAGKGTSKEIKVAKFLAEQYNVDANEWKKVRGDGYVVCKNGEIMHSELHWFESQMTGRIKMKVKRYFNNES